MVGDAVALAELPAFVGGVEGALGLCALQREHAVQRFFAVGELDGRGSRRSELVARAPPAGLVGERHEAGRGGVAGVQTSRHFEHLDRRVDADLLGQVALQRFLLDLVGDTQALPVVLAGDGRELLQQVGRERRHRRDQDRERRREGRLPRLVARPAAQPLRGAERPRRDRSVLQERVQVLGQRRSRLVAVLGLGRDRLVHDVLEVRRHGGERGQARHPACFDALHDPGEVEAAQRLRARHGFVEGQAEAVDVAGARDVPVAPTQLLGRRVDRRADHRQGLRALLLGLEVARPAEVGEQRRAVAADEHVAGLDVEVQDARLVRRVRRPRDVAHEAREEPHAGLAEPVAGRLGCPQRLTDPREVVFACVRRQGSEQGLERAAVDPLHRDRRDLAVVDDVVDLDDVRVLEARQHPRLLGEHALGAALGAEPLRRDLDRDVPVELLLAREVDGAHAAVPDLGEQAVAGQLRVACVRGALCGRVQQVGKLPADLRVVELA